MLASQKVTLNTAVMYVKMILTIGITLYTTRILLKELGANDFGIFNVVAGVIAMLSFMNVAMSTSVRRYLSNALGMNDDILFARVFHASIRIHILFGIASVIVFEIIGLFLFDDFLNIAPERMKEAYIIYQCMIVSTFFTIISIPYTSVINAYEDIYVISIIYTLESLLKLGIALYLLFTPFDKLIVYGFLLATVYSLTTFIQRIYCYKHYAVLKLKPLIDKGTYFSLLHFFGYSSISYVTKLASEQGMILVLNFWGGAVINAAYAIANQINGQMNYFSNSLLQAIEPQIMKSEGACNRERSLRLSILTCKFSFFIISFFCIPIIIQLPYILNIWLGDVPDYTVVFCRIVLISTIISQITLGLQSGIYAKGDIKRYQLTISLLQLLLLPLALFLIHLGCPIYLIVSTFIIIEILLLYNRLYFAHKIINLSVYIFIKKNIFPSIISFTLCYLFTALISNSLITNIYNLCIVCCCSFLIFFLLFWFITLNREEKNILKAMINVIRIKFKN